jgi:hypothetical protein
VRRLRSATEPSPPGKAGGSRNGTRGLSREVDPLRNRAGSALLSGRLVLCASHRCSPTSRPDAAEPLGSEEEASAGAGPSLQGRDAGGDRIARLPAHEKGFISPPHFVQIEEVVATFPPRPELRDSRPAMQTIARLGKEAFLEHMPGAKEARPHRVRGFLEEQGFEVGADWRELEICDGIGRWVNVVWSRQAVDALMARKGEIGQL